MKQAKDVTMIKERNPHCMRHVAQEIIYYSINLLIRVTEMVTPMVNHYPPVSMNIGF